MILDNNGFLLMVELKANSPAWSDMSYGQRLTYINFVANGKGRQIAVCAQHNKVDRINTLTDITRFQVMYWNGSAVDYLPVRDGSLWPQFIKWFFERRENAD